MEEYQELVGKFYVGKDAMAEMASAPRMVSEVIYRAATDGSTQLRYTAGEDVKQMFAARKIADDETFMRSIKEQFGI